MNSNVTTLKPKVLVYDDNKATQEWYLNSIGEEYDVTIVSDEIECIKLLRIYTPDVAIFDVVLPGLLDGLHILDYIKETMLHRQIKVAVISSPDFQHENEGRAKFCADAYFKKPVQLTELKEWLCNATYKLRNEIVLWMR